MTKQEQASKNYFKKAKTEALALKLRCLELEVLNATYTKDSVAALRKVIYSNEKGKYIFTPRNQFKKCKTI